MLMMKRSSVSILIAILGLLQDANAFTVISSIPTKSLRRIRGRNGGSTSSSVCCVESTQLLEDYVPPSKPSKRHTKNGTTNNINSNKQFLNDLHLPRGLREAVINNSQHVFSKRIWIIDNSGSMKMMDGHEILHSAGSTPTKKKKNTKDCTFIKNNQQASNSFIGASVSSSTTTSSCSSTGRLTTRWAEVQETVNCHAQLSSVLGVPTDFRLLNPPSAGGPQNFRVGYHHNRQHHGPLAIPTLVPFFGSRNNKSECHRATKIMQRNQPAGKTPLHTAVQEIRTEVIKMLPQLRTDGMKVAIVICTDGCDHDHHQCVQPDGSLSLLPTTTTTEPKLNQELRAALESLQGLPVCVVIRLCTDYGQIVDFYNDLDGQLGEVSFLDVLDDYQSEASEVYFHNPWLNYALVLHRLREMGMQGSSALFDLLDERSFTRDEIRDFCALLFGTDLLPDPWYDWENFLTEVDRLQQREEYHWHPRKGAMAPWIDVDQLARQL
jgi:hypothetical protein